MHPSQGRVELCLEFLVRGGGVGGALCVSWMFLEPFSGWVQSFF
jgi:hypothetical protein